MCGIVGGLALGRDALVERERVCRMATLVAHRGPDDEGWWGDATGRVALGHRRLSVIDVAGGHQPMSNDSGTVVLVFNGEIYNYREEREALAGSGITFRTNSDTEVLLRLYERYGSECVHRLRGMFAFALWDATRQELPPLSPPGAGPRGQEAAVLYGGGWVLLLRLQLERAP